MSKTEENVRIRFEDGTERTLVPIPDLAEAAEFFEKETKARVMLTVDAEAAEFPPKRSGSRTVHIRDAHYEVTRVFTDWLGKSGRKSAKKIALVTEAARKIIAFAITLKWGGISGVTLEDGEYLAVCQFDDHFRAYRVSRLVESIVKNTDVPSLEELFSRVGLMLPADDKQKIVDEYTGWLSEAIMEEDYERAEWVKNVIELYSRLGI